MKDAGSRQERGVDMKKMLGVLLICLLLPVLVGCGSGGDESLAVAEGFWRAMENEDIEAARSYCTRETAGAVTINKDKEPQDVDVSFGSVEIVDGESHVSTTIVSTNEDGSMMSIPMETILVKRDGEWRVDAARTMMSVFSGAMSVMMDSMKKGMEEMGQAMAESMKSAVEDAGAAAVNPEGK